MLVATIGASVVTAATPGLQKPVVVPPAVPNRPLVTGIVQTPPSDPAQSAAFFTNLARARGTVIRLFVYWDQVAPQGAEKPFGFDPRDPADPAYRWEAVDRQVRSAVSSGVSPIISAFWAPYWALDGEQSGGRGAARPNPQALADFFTAAAKRYSGSFADLPRVRLWQVWNEPNLPAYISPQYDSAGRLVSADWYRSMVNAAADAIHAVHADNVVIAGGQSPFGPDAQSPDRGAPLTFMRSLLCLSAAVNPKPVCRKPVRFDVWAHHPYTSGSPTHHAAGANDVSLPDLWKMRVLLEAGVKAGTLVSRGDVGFWVTEFSWDTNPPDPLGVPERLHARWVAEGMFRMWSQGVSAVAWFQLRDQPFTPSSPVQSGLYFRGEAGIESDKPKLALTAFRFPFVAFREPKTKTIMYWGRSPAGRAGVIVDQQVSGKWRSVKTLRPNRHGIFSGRYPSPARKGFLRARLVNGKDAALPFSLVVPPDRPGCTWGTC